MLYNINASAIDLPRESPVPGGIKILNITKYNTSGNIKAYFSSKEVLVIDNGNQSYAIIGIPLNLKPMPQTLTLSDSSNMHKISFNIFKSNYSIEKLNYKLKESINHELYTNIDPLIYSKWTTKSYPSTLLFNKPVDGVIIGKFGLERIYLNSTRALHNGIDISVPDNSSIHVPLAGTVILTGRFNLFGNTIIVDHGHGLMTLYAHLNTILVTKNQKVLKSQIIATSGQGDIISQSHLHWSIILNGTFVNPELFIK
jgi:murein DD-endopeptidase MepM/ murein hydrolase activator NlpD